jgi:hypothetical protein
VGSVHFADDCAGNYIARSKFLRFGVTLHETFEIDVAEDAALAAQRFGKQEARCACDGESRRMELHELHVRKDGTGFVGDGHSIARRDSRIGCFAVELAEAAGSEQNRAGTHFVKGTVRLVDKAQANDAAVSRIKPVVKA